MADPLWINASGGAPAYSANEMRQAMALALMYDGRNVGARSGVRPGGDQLQVTVAGSTITVQPGVACLDSGLTTPQGPYWLAIPVAEMHTLTAADATNPRKDIVIVRVYDHDEDLSGLRLARTEYLPGTAGPAPSEPAVPAGAFRLATIDVPASGGGSPAVTDRRPWTVAPGGILPVASDSTLAAGTEGRYRDRLDTNVLERDSGSAWETIADPSTFRPWETWTPTWSSSGTAPSLGNGGLIGLRRQVGRTMDVLIRLTWGSTTTGGTGDWRFDLPGQPTTNLTPLCALVEDSSTGVDYPAVARISSSAPGSIQRIGAHTATGAIGAVSASHPMVWASGDVLIIKDSYPLA